MLTFAYYKGVYPPANEKLFEYNFNQRSKELNRELKKYFQVNDSIYKHHYRKHKRWETKIKFEWGMEIDLETLLSQNLMEKEQSLFEKTRDEESRRVNLHSGEVAAYQDMRTYSMYVYMIKQYKYKKLTLNISEDLHKQLKIMAAYKETTMTGLVMDLVRKELKKFKSSEN